MAWLHGLPLGLLMALLPAAAAQPPTGWTAPAEPDVPAFLDEVEPLFRAAWAQRGMPQERAPMLISSHEDAAPTTTGGTQTPTKPYTLRFGVPGGDLDGDGRGDVLLLETRYPEGADSIAAVRGIDGTPLWTLDESGVDGVAFPLSVGDLTGDGAEDLLVVELSRAPGTSLDQCLPLPLLCAGVGSSTHSWNVRLINGATGRDAWSREIAGTVQTFGGVGFAGIPVGGAYATLGGYALTNASLFPVVVPDVSGDGVDDLVLNAFDALAEGGGASGFAVAGAWAFQSQGWRATNALVLTGTDGALLAALRHDYVPRQFFGGSFLLPAGNLVGDATPDLAWVTGAGFEAPQTCAYTVTDFVCPVSGYTAGNRGWAELGAIDGATLEADWSQRILDPLVESAMSYPAFMDLTGDGRDDFVLAEAMEDSAACRIGVVSGAEGEVAWRQERAAWGCGIGPLPIRGGTEPLVIWINPSFDFGPPLQYAFDVEVLHGRDGSTMDTRRHEATGDPAGDGLTYVGSALIAWQLLDDLNGDGARDVNLLGAVDTYTPEGPPQALSLSVIASGANGSALARTDAWTYTKLDVAGDLDGDAAIDLVQYEATWRNETWQVNWTARPLADGPALWTLTHAPDAGVDVRVRMEFVANATGRNATDVLLSRTFDSDEPHSAVQLLDGASAQRAWIIGVDEPGLGGILEHGDEPPPAGGAAPAIGLGVLILVSLTLAIRLRPD